MKKLLFIFTLVFAFSISANAQDKKATVKTTVGASIDPKVAAKKDADDLKALVSLNDDTTLAFYNLFEQKYQTLAVPELSAERRAVLKNVMEAKIRATLNGTDMAKLEANPALFKRLVE